MLKGLAVWFIIAVIESILGTLRQLFLEPRVGEVMASRIGWPLGFVIVLGTAIVFARWVGLKDRGDLLLLGAIWAALTFVLEIGVGLLRGFDAARLLAEINPLGGGLMLYSLAVMFIAPLVAARIRRL